MFHEAKDILYEQQNGLNRFAVEEAVQAFINDPHTEKGINKEGLYKQTVTAIANIIVTKQNSGGHFWIDHKDGKVLAYAICFVNLDVDFSPCYWIQQVWVDKNLRRSKKVLEMYQQLEAQANELGCKYILAPSSRGSKGYLNWLPGDWSEHLVVLKKQIGE